jgi:hypothetical protein
MAAMDNASPTTGSRVPPRAVAERSPGIRRTSNGQDRLLLAPEGTAEDRSAAGRGTGSSRPRPLIVPCHGSAT